MCIPLTPCIIPLRVIPESVHERIFAGAFNHLLRGQGLTARLGEIDGKSVTIRVTDIPCEFHFRFQAGRLRAATRQRMGDVTISGTLAGFLRLATRKEDPDTLFFRRELNIEGETETGVHIKNILDSLEYDWDAHFDAVLFPPLAKGAKLFLHIVRRNCPQKLLHLITMPDHQERSE